MTGSGVGGAALRNSDGTDNGKRFALGFGIVPILLIIIAAAWWYRRRRAKKRAAAEKASGNPKAKNTGQGKKKRRKKSRWGGFGWSDRIKPAAAPNAYKRDKEILPTM